MPSPIRIQVFGSFCVRTASDEVARFRTTRAAEVVARLALQPDRRLSRATLAGELWPEEPREGQLRNLRPALSYARDVIGHEHLIPVNPQSLRLVNVTTDWEEVSLREREALAEESSDGRIQALLRLDMQLRAPLLEGWEADWIQPFREFHLRRQVGTLSALAEEFGAKGDWETSLEFSRRIQELDPTSEKGFRITLRMLAQLGRSAEALAAFREYQMRLKQELGMKVSPALREYALQIIHQRPDPKDGPLTSPQQEFIQGLLRHLLDEDPLRLMTLLASKTLNWEVLRHGSELLPLLERTLERCPEWSEDRAGAIKRILVGYSATGDWTKIKTFAEELYALGSDLDKIAGLNHLGMRAFSLHNYDEAEDLYDQAEAIAHKLGNAYLVSVSHSNKAVVLVATMRPEEALRIIEQSGSVLAADLTRAGRFGFAQYLFLKTKAHFFAGDIGSAAAGIAEILLFLESHGLSREFEHEQGFIALLTLDQDRNLARDRFCRSLEHFLIQRRFKTGTEILSVAIQGLFRMGETKAAERFAGLVQAEFAALGATFTPAFASLLPPHSIAPQGATRGLKQVVLDLYDEFRRL